MATKNETGFAHEGGTRETPTDAHSDYGTSPISGDNLSQSESSVNHSLSEKNVKVTSTGYASGETHSTMTYTQNGKVVGELNYGEYEGTPNVTMIEVGPEYRRQGIGTKLLSEACDGK